MTGLSPQRTGTGQAAKRKCRISGEITMRTLNEAAIDKIVATCDGDLRGALMALLLVNEQLEAELAQLYAVVSPGGLTQRGNQALH